MRMPPGESINAAARTFAATYIAALLMGPQGLTLLLMSAVYSPFVAPGVLLVSGFAAGFIAGPRLGGWAVLLAFLWAELEVLAVFSSTLRQGSLNGSAFGLQIIPLFGILVVLPCLVVIGSAWAGGRLLVMPGRLSRFHHWPQWRNVGIGLALLLAYSCTLGRGVALRTLEARQRTMYPSAGPVELRASLAGVYIRVSHSPGHTDYFMDPSGLLIVSESTGGRHSAHGGLGGKVTAR